MVIISNNNEKENKYILYRYIGWFIMLTVGRYSPCEGMFHVVIEVKY